MDSFFYNKRFIVWKLNFFKQVNCCHMKLTLGKFSSKIIILIPGMILNRKINEKFLNLHTPIPPLKGHFLPVLYLSYFYPNEDIWNQLNNWIISSLSFEFTKTHDRHQTEIWGLDPPSHIISHFFLYYFYLKQKLYIKIILTFKTIFTNITMKFFCIIYYLH